MLQGGSRPLRYKMFVCGRVCMRRLLRLIDFVVNGGDGNEDGTQWCMVQVMIMVE